MCVIVCVCGVWWRTQEHETLADRMEYTVRKTLLTRFYYGVCAYLVASILVIL